MENGIGRDTVSVQDADLLARLNHYFDTLDHRLKHGQGWLIFNSARDRGARIVRHILERLAPHRPFFSSYHLPWRDFALHAYVSTVALPQDAQLLEAAEANGTAGARRREFTIATNVANATALQLASADVVVLSNIAPANLHEALVLSQTAVERAAGHRALIALTGHDPWSLAGAFDAADPSGTTWRRFYEAMHRTSFIAH